MLCDLRYGDVTLRNWAYIPAPWSQCSRLAPDGIPAVGVVDAKSVYDILSKYTAGGKHDRRTAIELAICRDGMHQTGSVVRWATHSRMPVDCMTKADVAKANFALTRLLHRGRFSLTLPRARVAPRTAPRPPPDDCFRPPRHPRPTPALRRQA